MATKRNRRRRKPTAGRDSRDYASERSTRPHPVEAIASKQADLARRLLQRKDRFSQLLGKSFKAELVGYELATSSGLTAEEFAELEGLRPTAHADLRKEVLDATGKLRELLAQGDPLVILSMVQAANLLAAEGEYFEPTHDGLETKVELVAGLLLTQTPASSDSTWSDETITAVFDGLDEMMDIVFLLNLSAPRDEGHELAELRFSSALHWMTQRGSSYEHHGRELAESLYQPFDAWCMQRYGFAIHDVLRLGEIVEELWSLRMGTLLFAASQSEDAHEAAELIKARIVAASTWTINDLEDGVLPRARAQAVLDELSYSPGSLQADTYSGLFDQSPLVEHPFFRHGDRFSLVIPGMLSRDAVTLLERRFMSEAPNFSKARAQRLDELAVGYLADLLPGSRTYTNLYYGDPELDGLVLFDRIALVVEGKGTPLSVAARRGDVNRLKRDLARAVEEAWTQGARARSFLLSDEDAVFTDARGREIVRVPAGSLDQVLIVNPTLHQLAGHASQLPRLRSLDLFPDEEYPWSVAINDLRVIAETSDNPAVFLHYLTWRDRLPLGDGISVGDEIDLWASYFLGERFGGLADGVHHNIGNASTDFDAYYAGVLHHGPPSDRPRKFLEEPVTSFVERMAAERPSGWLDAAGVCLDLSIVELGFVIREVKSTWRQANRERRVVVSECGRVRLVGFPRDASLEDAITEDIRHSTECTFRIFVEGSKAKRGDIAWAVRTKPVTFELSDYEKAAAQRLAQLRGT
jgi:hypothetical protein